MKFTAVGDFLVQQPYKTPYNGFEVIREYIAKGDARFFNLETTLNKEGSCCASQFSGGSYLRADPTVLDTAKAYGFNMVTNNNNHAFDFSIGGFLSSLECIEQSGLVHAGTGRDMPQAEAPGYLETNDGKVALIAVSASFDASAIAGNPSEFYPGRPGVNGLRHSDMIQITAEQMKALKEIADQTGINHENELNRSNGYLPELPEGRAEFSDLQLEIAENPGLRTEIKAADTERIMSSIKEAKKNAEYVLVSLHNHSISGEKENVPDYLVEFCHKCIDNGANAIIGHGPHFIRAIEIYRGCPVFHSLGDFVLQLNSIQSAPADFYEKHNVPVNAGIKKLLSVRSDNGKRGLMYERDRFESFIPFWEMQNGKLIRLEFMPVELGFDCKGELRGIPQPANDTAFIERLKKLSEHFGTKILFDGVKFSVEIK